MTTATRFLAAFALLAAPLCAQVDVGAPKSELLEGVGITPKLDAQASPDARFTDEAGHGLAFGELFDGKRPIALTFNFSSCPRLCSLQLDEAVRGFQGIDLTPGVDYRVVTVSMDPDESPVTAARTKERYCKEWGNPNAAGAWTFLTGDKANIRKLADSVGYGFAYVDGPARIQHQAAVIFLTPQGHVARYLGGITYDPFTLRLSLVEASGGKIGTWTDDFFQLCYRFDPGQRSYVLFADNVMKVGAALTVAALVWFFLRMRRYEVARKRVPRQPEVAR